MKYVIDIDGTICHSNDAYIDSIPFEERIEKINKLYLEGNQIIYYTARGMGSSNNDAIAAKLKYFDLTKKQLELWDVKYNKLFMSKPSGDIYIDDKACHANLFFKDLT